MTETSHPVPGNDIAQPLGWTRPDTVLFALTTTTLVLIAAQFALAWLGAFTMNKTSADNAYGAHMILGVVIGALTWLILAAVLASRAARAHRRTLWLALLLAMLAIPRRAIAG